MLVAAPIAGLAAPAQVTPHAQGAPKPALKSAHRPVASEFDVVNWLSLTPAANSLIRAPNQQAGVDLTTHDDDTYITVYARKKRPDLGPRPITGYAPMDSDASIPNDVRYIPPEHCANSAYNTVAGQPAGDQDLIGYLGSGAGC